MERLSTEQEELLKEILKDNEPGVLTSSKDTHLHRELAEEGFLDDYQDFNDGDAQFIVSSKGKAYFEEIEREKELRKEANRHDWAMTGTNVFFGFAGAILGGIGGFILGRIFPG